MSAQTVAVLFVAALFVVSAIGWTVAIWRAGR